LLKDLTATRCLRKNSFVYQSIEYVIVDAEMQYVDVVMRYVDAAMRYVDAAMQYVDAAKRYVPIHRCCDAICLDTSMPPRFSSTEIRTIPVRGQFSGCLPGLLQQEINANSAEMLLSTSSLVNWSSMLQVTLKSPSPPWFNSFRFDS